MEQKTAAEVEAYKAQGVRASWDVLVPDLYALYYFSQLSKVLQYYVKSCGGLSSFQEKLKSEGYRSWLAEKVRRAENIVYPRWNDQSIISRCTRTAWIGKSIRQVSESLGMDSVSGLIQILQEDIDTCYVQGLAPGLAGVGEGFFDLPQACIGTDNGAFPYDFEGDAPDLPQDHGTPTAFCGITEYIVKRQEQGRPLEEIVRQLTGNAAEVLGLTDRGYIRKGYRADLVIADLKNLSANKDMIDPRSKPAGIHAVLVNGRIAMRDGVHTHQRSGEVVDYRKR
ncbi:amidohydrolase family protein [Ihubacter sp. rT4E-8]|uniref:amidohydrolase family protein n=1 Tax=Ihubacter sp. rT4E-8 TaxID=3242369 RepID=UPI003CE6D1F0